MLRLEILFALIKGAETYQDYLGRGVIFELDSAGAKSAPALDEFYRLTFGMPIMLINDTAQIALLYHLNDACGDIVGLDRNSIKSAH